MVASWIKFLKNQNKNVSININNAVEKIIKGETIGLDIKDIKGKPNYFRCRIGNIRIIYKKDEKGEIEIKKIGYRGDIYK